ncbi:xylan alpha-(1-_2)-glucuronosidase [Micromonospora gifhornensis]|uniref:Xylan alpha-(1->2)-glucuronosidase n=1 Tax=Micromonospora gifhornensis TaxID=84594 RepID=A0ABQ4ILL5_9ACTN|nr:alpha-glucuronidase [Micromonospora gifhornensis]GIJ18804.1 xylan alpha-(1->2)-glucuronosidase [Micromonospora gifhornensis]
MRRHRDQVRMSTPDPTDVHPAWLPDEAWRAIGVRRILVCGEGTLVDTVQAEVERAADRYGGTARRNPTEAGLPPADLVLALTDALPPDSSPATEPGPPETLTATATATTTAVATATAQLATATAQLGESLGVEGFALARHAGVTVVLADAPAGLLYGLFELVRLGEAAFGPTHPVRVHRPVMARRMLDHWDNVDVHPVMGQVERGYAGGSIFWHDGRPRGDVARVTAYARLLAACGINAVSVNNVNVHATEARLLTERLDDVVDLADLLRPYAIRVHLAVTFAAPMVLGGLPTADPLDQAVRDWWAETTARVYARIPDFGGYLVKADSEGQPGPFSYGRDHADGANLLAEALAPYGGVVHWRAFVYNHRQDWRDRSTDRARAAYDHFAPLDGRFRDNVIVQVKHGPIDFQTREPVSPVIAAMPGTRLAVEFQVTQEYTGQQKHVCYLAPWWSEILRFAPWGDDGRTVADVAADGGGLVAVSNVGDDEFWTGHPLAQANLYAFGRLCWNPRLRPQEVLDEWIDLTFAPDARVDPELLRRTLHEIMDDSWRTYERYTAPLGVGFMVRPGHHYGPDVDGYEYTPWGTYHFADRDGVGVDRTRATGTGFTGQYPPPWSEQYESIDTCPDELLLFFHHVPYGHLLHCGSTVIQHIYDTHFEGVREVEAMCRRWEWLARLVDPAVHARVTERLAEQVRCAREWCDQVNAYFHRKSGIPDAHGRALH